MALSHDLISQFAKIVKEDKKQSSESTVYGTVVTDGNGNKYVKLDGSDQLTPLSDDERPSADSTTTSANEGERVSVLIKNHTATVTGNISSPAARTADMQDAINKIAEFEIAVSDKASIKDLDAERARIDTLVSDNVTIKQDLTAAKASIAEIENGNVPALLKLIQDLDSRVKALEEKGL